MRAGRHSTKLVSSALSLVIAGFFVLSCVQLLRFARFKLFGTDEFTYMHGAWLVSEGLIPFRDFLNFHFPLSIQLLAMPFWILGGTPDVLVSLRLGMALMMLIGAFACWHLSRREGRQLGELVADRLLPKAQQLGHPECRPGRVLGIAVLEGDLSLDLELHNVATNQHLGIDPITVAC